jgi:hypothetical protein
LFNGPIAALPLSFPFAFRYGLVDGSVHEAPGTGEDNVPKVARESFQQLKQDLNLRSRRRIFDLP